MSIAKLPISSPLRDAKRRPARSEARNDSPVLHARLRMGRDRVHRRHHHHERRDIDPVRPGEAGGGDDDAAEGRPDDAGDLPEAVVERDRRPQPLRPDERRHHRRPRGPVDGRRARRDRGDDEEDRDRRRPGGRADDQAERRQRLHELRGEQQATAIHPVGERAAEQGDDDERHELDEPDQTDEERRSGEDEHLVRERDQRHLGPDPGDDPADREQAEIARVAKRARVHGDAAQAAHRPAAEGRHARRSWHSHAARRRTRAYHGPVPGDAPLQLVWFRRDLRIDDNPALAAAAERGPVACCFVLDPRIFRGPGAAGVRVRFMLQGLEDLDARLRSFGGGLHLRRGTSEREVVAAGVGARRGRRPRLRRRRAVRPQA